MGGRGNSHSISTATRAVVHASLGKPRPRAPAPSRPASAANCAADRSGAQDGAGPSPAGEASASDAAQLHAVVRLTPSSRATADWVAPSPSSCRPSRRTGPISRRLRM